MGRGKDLKDSGVFWKTESCCDQRIRCVLKSPITMRVFGSATQCPWDSLPHMRPRAWCWGCEEGVVCPPFAAALFAGSLAAAVGGEDSWFHLLHTH